MKPEIQETIENVASTQREASAAIRALNELRRKCEHSIVPDRPNEIDATSGHCEHCGHKTIGWYCPDNAPSHECVYIGGNEWCVKCGEPAERL